MGALCELQEDLLAEIQRQAIQMYPGECCGILLGSRENFIVREVYATQNAIMRTRGKDHFLIDPLDIYRAEKKADEKGLDMVGFYHSHPDHPAELSAEDDRNMIPELLYLIVSVTERGCREIKFFIKKKLDEGATELHTDY